MSIIQSIKQVLLTITILLVAVMVAQGQSKTSRAGTPKTALLRMSAKADRADYRIGETMKLEVSLENVGDTEIYVYDDVCFSPSIGYGTHVFDQNRKEVFGEREFIKECLMPPPKPGAVSRFTRMAPHSSLKMQEVFQVKELVPEAGEYNLVLTYRSSLSAEFLKQAYANDPLGRLPIWTTDQGFIDSGQVHFRVTKS